MIEEILTRRAETICRRWREAILATYPAETARMFAREQDPFANPVGSTTKDAVEAMVGALGRGDAKGALPALDRIVRLRSVQGFSPSAAVGFVLLLKTILREELADAGASPADRAAADGRVDALMLEAFDIYVACREKLFEIKSNEVKMRTAKLLERALRGKKAAEEG